MGEADVEDSGTPAATGGWTTYRVAQVLCLPVFATPVLFVLFALVWLVSEEAALPFWVAFLVTAICGPLLAALGLLVCLVAGSRGGLAADVESKMWRLFWATAGLIALLVLISSLAAF